MGSHHVAYISSFLCFRRRRRQQKRAPIYLGSKRLGKKLCYSSKEVGYFDDQFGRTASCIWLLGESIDSLG